MVDLASPEGMASFRAIWQIARPLTLAAIFNGGYAGNPYDPNGRVGFSAHGSLTRSDFGIAYGIPAPGTTMGVGDEIQIALEAEFTGPPLAASVTQP